MKCFKCQKEFNSEQGQGICPNCGAFCQEEKEEISHLRSDEKRIWKRYKISTLYFRACVLIFLFVFIGGTAFGAVYPNMLKKWVQRKAIATEAEYVEHEAGEAFSFREIKLTVADTKVISDEERTNRPLAPGKKLVAVKLLGEGDGNSGAKNYMSPAYIRYNNLCYWQISAVSGYQYARRSKINLFELGEMCGTVKGEGWLLFWLDSDGYEFTLCLEERISGDAYIQKVHSIKVYLEE